MVPCTFKPYPCCNDDTATCNGGTWTVVPGTCPAATCPAQVPANGSACGCPDAIGCIYKDATCPNSGNEQVAFCNKGAWSVGNPSSCANQKPITCNGVTCAQGQVCVRIGTTTDVGCATSPCPANSFDCSCAHSLCPAAHPICTGTDGPFVNCQ